MTESAKIYFSKKSDPRPFLERVVEIFEPALKSRVLLKPNLVSDEPYPTTTDPVLFRELIKLLKPLISLAAGDASAADLPNPHSALKGHGLAKTADDEGVPFYDFYLEKMIERKSSQGDTLKFSALAEEYECIISLPVLKAHIILLLTGALKNQVGFLSRKDRIGAHFRGVPRLSRSVAGINELVKPGLFIVDFRETLINSNEVRHGGRKAKGGMMFAGSDPVALDFFGFSLLREIEPKLMGKSPEEISYLDLAQRSGLGSAKFELIDLD